MSLITIHLSGVELYDVQVVEDQNGKVRLRTTLEGEDSTTVLIKARERLEEKGLIERRGHPLLSCLVLEVFSMVEHMTISVPEIKDEEVSYVDSTLSEFIGHSNYAKVRGAFDLCLDVVLRLPETTGQSYIVLTTIKPKSNISLNRESVAKYRPEFVQF